MRRKSKKKQKIKPIIFAVVVLLLLGSIFNTYLASPYNKNNNGEWKNPLELFAGSTEGVNILVFGVDSISKDSDNKRSDSIMLLTIDKDKQKPTIISIPRDTRVKIPGRKNHDKINHSHAYGGPELLVKTVEQLLDIKINYYVGINYNAVIEVVDALGGVEMDVPINMKYSDPYDEPPLHIDIKKGLQVLDGQQSIHFMRFRKGYANQDLGRIEAQQQFAKALVDKTLSPATILKIPQLIDIIYENVNTNISRKNMLSLGLMYSTLDKDSINKITLSGKPKMVNGVSYFVVSEDDIVELKNNYLMNEQQSKEELDE